MNKKKKKNLPEIKDDKYVYRRARECRPGTILVYPDTKKVGHLIVNSQFDVENYTIFWDLYVLENKTTVLGYRCGPDSQYLVLNVSP